MRIVNWQLLANPVNWVIILLVLYLAALIAHLLASSAAPFSLP